MFSGPNASVEYDDSQREAIASLACRKSIGSL